MGGADFINVLYSEFLVYDPSDPQWINRDRFFLDPGHMSPMLYSVLAMSGFYTMDDLKSFRQWGSVTPGHPEVDVKHGVENTSGPLGQGHVMAVGAAIALAAFHLRSQPSQQRKRRLAPEHLGLLATDAASRKDLFGDRIDGIGFHHEDQR